MTDRLAGVFTALVTPFRDQGIDWEAFGTLIDRQIAAGIHGLVPCGTTGESPTLDPVEHDEVVRFCVDRAAGRVPVLAGTGSNSTAEAIARTQAARAAGADAALVITPYYNKPTPAGLVNHYREVAAVGLPVMLYNVPSRTAVCIDSATYEELAKIPGVVATKEASGDLGLVEDVIAQGALKLLSGDDALTFPLMCLGGVGVVSVASNLVPRAMVELYDRAARGDIEGAREQHYHLLPLLRALFWETNPTPVKAALAMQGDMEDIVRAPLSGITEETWKRLAPVVERYREVEPTT